MTNRIRMKLTALVASVALGGGVLMALAACATPGGLMTGAQGQASALTLLVLTGQDGDHDWDANSTRLIENLRAWGITDVERQAMRSDGDWSGWTGNYADYDAVVFAYYTANAPAQPIQDLADYVASGGSLVVVHSALAGLNGHEAFDEMIGIGWRGGNYGRSLHLDDAGQPIIREAGDGRGAAHPPLMDFAVRTRDADHPIMRGIPPAWTQANDELYFFLRGPARGMHVLATAQPPHGEHAPMLWTRNHGEGRVFVTTLGHHIPSIESLGFMTTLVRGIEWAATGDVTVAVPTNLRGGDLPIREAPRFE
jgi:uncharacterized protein